MKTEIKKTMSYLGSIKTRKKAKSSRKNGKKGGYNQALKDLLAKI